MDFLVHLLEQADRFLNTLFNGLNNLVRNVEYSFVNLVSTIIPWTVLLIPAMMTFVNVGLVYPNIFIPIVTGVNVAGLGIALTSTGFDFMRHNRSRDNKAKMNRIPWWFFGVIIGGYVLYLAIVIIVNVLLHTDPSEQNAFLANIALTLLEIPAVAIAAMRAYQNSIAKENEKKKQETPAFTKYDYRTEIGRLSDEEKMTIVRGGVPLIKERWENIHPTLPAKWLRRIKKELGIDDE